jgi:hypothetical protein
MHVLAVRAPFGQSEVIYDRTSRGDYHPPVTVYRVYPVVKKKDLGLAKRQFRPGSPSDPQFVN